MKSPNRILFDISKEVFEHNISKEDGIKKLIEVLKINPGSARMIVGQILPQLIGGQKFTRTLSVDSFDDILSYIYEDYGTEGLKTSLNALQMHIDYSKEKGDAKIKLRKVYQRYLSFLKNENQNSDQDQKEQNEISEFFKKTKSREEIIEELKNTKDTDDEIVNVNQKSYKRNNKSIALIKILRNFECQICGYSISKRDGTKYIEAAHIQPKHMKGKENSNNIILLCPNHHKEFDLGVLKIIEHDEDKIYFELNGQKINLSLVIK